MFQVPLTLLVVAGAELGAWVTHLMDRLRTVDIHCLGHVLTDMASFLAVVLWAPAGSRCGDPLKPSFTCCPLCYEHYVLPFPPTMLHVHSP